MPGWVRSRRTARSLAAIAPAAAAVVLAGCSSRLGMPEPASEEGETVLDLWRGVFWAAVAVAAVVWGLILWSVIRFRRRSDAIPTQVADNVRVEVVYSVLPVLIVAVIFFFTVRTEGEVSDLADDPATVVQVEGFQWQWQFTYVGEEGAADDVVVTGTPGDAPELVLPVDATARLELDAVDVNHAFWVPNFLGKRDLIPGVDNEIDVTPVDEGEYRGRCAEFCGLDHWRMSFTVRVVGQAEFDTWLADRRAEASA